LSNNPIVCSKLGIFFHTQPKPLELAPDLTFKYATTKTYTTSLFRQTNSLNSTSNRNFATIRTLARRSTMPQRPVASSSPLAQPQSDFALVNTIIPIGFSWGEEAPVNVLGVVEEMNEMAKKMSSSKIDHFRGNDYTFETVEPYASVEKRSKYAYLLYFRKDKLLLKQTGVDSLGPICCDFSGDTLQYRIKHGNNRSSPLIRSITLSKKPANETTILDATGGLGTDAFVIAAQGFRVTVLESNPIVFQLLKDGIRRGLKDAEISHIVQRMEIKQVDAYKYFQDITEAEKSDIIYLDPMYPTKKRVKSNTKKEMSILRSLIGTSHDTYSMVESAKQAANHRVVLKRPFYSPVDSKCDRTYKSASTHYDIYSISQAEKNTIHLR